LRLSSTYSPVSHPCAQDTDAPSDTADAMNVDEDDNVEYVSEQLDANGSVLEAFSDVFARFQLPPEESAVSPEFMRAEALKHVQNSRTRT
jgi:splicing factor 3B subunit 2